MCMCRWDGYQSVCMTCKNEVDTGVKNDINDRCHEANPSCT